MQKHPILLLYALRLGQACGGFSILLAPILLLDPEYFTYAVLMLGFGALLLILPYLDAFKTVMKYGLEGSNTRTGAGGNGENRQKMRQQKRREKKESKKTADWRR